MYILTVIKKPARDGSLAMLEVLTVDSDINKIIKKYKETMLSGVDPEGLTIHKELDTKLTFEVEVSERNPDKNLRGE